MIVGINAWNIIGGGCITHLYEVLNVVEPELYGITKIIIWARDSTLCAIPDRKWLIKKHESLLDKSLPYRYYWQKYRLKRLADIEGCDVLFTPGGGDATGFRPVVTMSRNMLPFELTELMRYGISFIAFKTLLSRLSHAREFPRADGLILLNDYAKRVITGSIKNVTHNVSVIPHGISSRFSRLPKGQKPISNYDIGNPFKIIYVSRVEVYKHQWHVVEAVRKLRGEGYPVVLHLVGPDGSGSSRLERTLSAIPEHDVYVVRHGNIPYDALHDLYNIADMNIFASSCENMPNTLLESMAAGLPTACSNRGPMPEILGDAGIYFDPESAESIAQAVKQFLDSTELRERKAHAAYVMAQNYTWERCAEQTFTFLSSFCRQSITVRRNKKYAC